MNLQIAFFKSLIFFMLLYVSAVSVSLFTTTAQARTFTMVNKCSYPVWFGFIGSGSVPTPANNNYQLAANGGTNTATIPSGSTWSGVIAGRTNCTAAGCETGDCGGGTGVCTHGFSQPATQAEFTLSATGSDFYDVEVINGVNLPLSVTPSVPAQASSPYVCGAPGAAVPSAGLGACTWQFSPPLVEYQWVKAGGIACTSNANCSTGFVCGLSFNPGNTPLLKKTCGKLLGYWTADQICGVERNYGAPFNCSQALPSPQNNLTWWDLYACINVGSCYSSNAGTNCCGCVNWDKIGIAVPPAPLTQQCRNANPNWVSGVQPGLAWLKKACPSVYTYPYDDMSSTYTCRLMVNNTNAVNYTITFCPAGQTPPPPPPNQCLPPSNITSVVSADKKSVALSWQQPTDSLPISFYQVSNAQNVLLWKGTNNTQTSYTATLPGTDGTFTYHLASSCSGVLSVQQPYSVVVSTPTSGYGYTVYIGSPFLPVVINGTITCPDPVTRNPACLVKNQAINSTMVITGVSPHICNLMIQANGSVSVNPNSNYCFINSKAATPTTAGSISLPSKF